MVSNYTPNKCNYSIGKLDNVVYLVDSSQLGTIYIDNGIAYMSSANSTSSIGLQVYNLSLNEEESLDERYEFLHTVQFSINGYKTIDELLSKCFVILKDLDGNYWILNPKTQCKVTYTYTLGALEDHTDFTFSTKSNLPLLRLVNFDMSYSKPCHTYYNYGIKKLWINETSYSRISDSGVSFTNDGFKEVDYNKDSCTLQEIFDGTNVSHQLEFKINLNDYKSSWHYNLLEFNENKYAVVIQSNTANYAVGFHYGLQPSYVVEGTSDDAPNIITITLKDYHDQGSLIQLPTAVNFNHTSATTWNWVEDEYECVSTNRAKHLLMEQYDIYGNAMDLYKCLSGYTSQYSYLGDKLIGEFAESESIYFYSNNCVVTECKLNTSLTNSTFGKSGDCKSFTFICDSDWVASVSDSSILAYPTSGYANTEYTLHVCNMSEPTLAPKKYYLTITYCEGKTSTYEMTVKKQPINTIFPQGNIYSASCSGDTIVIPTNGCIRSISASSPVRNVQIQNGYIIIRINPYDCTPIKLNVTLCDGTTDNIYINANSRTVSGSPYCSGFDKYIDVSNQIYSGTSWVTVNEYAKLVEANSEDCGYVPPEPIYRSVIGVSYCIGYDKYADVYEQVSEDGGISWATTAITSELIEANSQDCGYVPPTPPVSGQYLTFVAEESGTFTFSPKRSNTISYSKNNGTWTQGNSVSVSSGDTVRWKGTMTSRMDEGIGTFSSTSNFSVQGNVMSLLYGDNFSGQTSLSGYYSAFNSLFYNCIRLTNIDYLVLLATTLSYDCYTGMFMNCTRLTTLPSGLLPATTLAETCYAYMFCGCSSLTTAPSLPATTLADWCYDSMFRDCISLTTAPELLATTLVDYCYVNMFTSCSSLNYIKCLATDISADSCTYVWTASVAASGTFVKNPSMSSWSSGADGIPSNWTVQNAT